MDSCVKIPPYLGPTDDEIATALQVVKDRDTAIFEQTRQAEIQCRQMSDFVPYTWPIAEPCNTWFAISKATLIRTERFDGFFTLNTEWAVGEDYIVCPLCGYLNRTYGRESVTKDPYRRLFSDTVTGKEYRNYKTKAAVLTFDDKDKYYPLPAHIAAKLESADLFDTAELMPKEARELQDLANSIK